MMLITIAVIFLSLFNDAGASETGDVLKTSEGQPITSNTANEAGGDVLKTSEGQPITSNTANEAGGCSTSVPGQLFVGKFVTYITPSFSNCCAKCNSIDIVGEPCVAVSYRESSEWCRLFSSTIRIANNGWWERTPVVPDCMDATWARARDGSTVNGTCLRDFDPPNHNKFGWTNQLGAEDVSMLDLWSGDVDDTCDTAQKQVYGDVMIDGNAGELIVSTTQSTYDIQSVVVYVGDTALPLGPSGHFSTQFEYFTDGIEYLGEEFWGIDEHVFDLSAVPGDHVVVSAQFCGLNGAGGNVPGGNGNAQGCGAMEVLTQLYRGRFIRHLDVTSFVQCCAKCNSEDVYGNPCIHIAYSAARSWCFLYSSVTDVTTNGWFSRDYIEPVCKNSWARGRDDDDVAETCFQTPWGWSNQLNGAGPFVLDLWTGGNDDCDTAEKELIGDVTINMLTGEVTVSATQTAYDLRTANLYIGTTEPPAAFLWSLQGDNGDDAFWGHNEIVFDNLQLLQGFYVIVNAEFCGVA